jgi:hypothetical protein
VIRDCLFRDNSAEETISPGWNGWAGAVYLRGSYATVDRCTFVGNSAMQGGGAIAKAEDGNLVLTDCTFVDNRAHWAGALWNEDSPCDIIGCRFIGNQAMLLAAQLGRPGYTGAIGGLWDGCVLNLTNCLLAGNTARYGGAMILNGRSVTTLTNSTVVHNRADFTGGGIFNEYFSAPSALHVRNGILWGNWPQQIETESPCITTVLYSCIQAGHVGTGNIAADPLFRDGPSGSWTANAVYDPVTGQTTFTDDTAVWTGSELVGKVLNPQAAQWRQSLIVANAETTIVVWGDFASLGAAGMNYQVHDYHLSLDSPAIDAGVNTAVPLDTWDLDGDGDTAERLPWDWGGGPRFFDHPHTPDTGSGTSPIVDMGADEFLPGEFHANDHVDLRDFRGFQWCFTLDSPPTGDCEYLDFELDGDVDMQDFVNFETFLNGS